MTTARGLLLVPAAAIAAAACAAPTEPGLPVRRLHARPVACAATVPARAAPAPVSCAIDRGGPWPAIAVDVGQPVRFENCDTICHRPFSSSAPNAFELPLLQPGAAIEHRFEHAGQLRVYCALHAHEQFTIEVRSNGGNR